MVKVSDKLWPMFHKDNFDIYLHIQIKQALHQSMLKCIQPFLIEKKMCNKYFLDNGQFYTQISIILYLKLLNIFY